MRVNNLSGFILNHAVQWNNDATAIVIKLSSFNITT